MGFLCNVSGLNSGKLLKFILSMIVADFYSWSVVVLCCKMSEYNELTLLAVDCVQVFVACCLLYMFNCTKQERDIRKYIVKQQMF